MTASSALRLKPQSLGSIPSIIHHRLLPQTRSLNQQASPRLISRRRPTTTPFTTRPPNQRLFTSSSAQPAPQQPNQPQSISGENWEKLSPEARIAWCEQDQKWGFLIFRCSYATEFDGAWNDLKRRIARMRESIATSSDAPAIAKTMDFVFVEDPALEGASPQELQRRFQAWARADSAGAGFDVDDCAGSRGARYEFFLRVDGEGLWGGYVGLVRGWPCEPGCEDWMKIRTSSVGAALYDQLGDPEVWYGYYTPPESGVSTTGW